MAIEWDTPTQEGSGITWDSPTAETAAPSTTSKVGSVLGGLGIGALKGGSQLLFSASAFNDANPVNREMLRSAPEVKKFVDTYVKPGFEAKTTPEKIGKAAENVAEFLIPGTQIRKAQAGINAMFEGTGLLKAAARVGGKAAVEGAAGATIAMGQTGDLKEAAKTGAFFGGLKVGTGAVGETLKAFRVPEKLYSVVFKNTYKDVFNELKTSGAAAFQKAHPEEYAKLVSEGIIKGTKDGVIQINETLAKEALDRGLKGSIRTMTNAITVGTFRTEKAVQDIAKNSTQKIPMKEKQYLTTLRSIEQEMKDIGFGDISKQAKVFADELKKSKGVASVELALGIRRLLYKVTKAASFDKPFEKLGLSQQNLRFLASELRTRLNKVPGMEKAMDDYVFNIDAMEHLAKEAKRMKNRQLFGFLDAVFFTLGSAGGFLQTGDLEGAAKGALGAYGLRKLTTSPTILTNTAQAIQRSGNLTKTGQAIKGLITSIPPFRESE